MRLALVAACLFAGGCGGDGPLSASLPSGNVDAGDGDAREEPNIADAVASPDTESGSASDTDAGAPLDADSDAALDAPFDSALDAPNDASSDTPPPRPTSKYCGDGIRDPVLEECDDGPGSSDDACSADCRVRSAVIARPVDASDAHVSSLVRALGTGPHVASAGDAGFGVVFGERGAETALWLQAFNETGGQTGKPIHFSADFAPTSAANPVVAALPGNRRYAVAWTDGLGGTPDVRLRLVDATAAVLGAALLAHTSSAGNQQDPDLLWAGDRLIAAWTDLLDLKWRAFDGNLSPLNDEQKLAASGAIESSVALARVGNGWGAAFRAGDRGLETIEVRAEGVAWSTPPELPGPTGDRPTLVELDSEHLLVLFTIGTDQNVARLRAALLSFSAPGPVTSAVFAQGLEPYAADATLTMRRPSAVRAGDDVYVAWEGQSQAADPLADEVFLAKVRLYPQVATQLSEELLFRLPHDTARTGPQRNARVAASPLFPGGALITTWEDASPSSPRNGAGLMLDFRPVPFVTLAPTDR